MKCGDLTVPESKVGLMGALLAQSEMGNPPDAPIPPLIYPPYFAKWEQGYPRRISLAHKKLNGKRSLCCFCVYMRVLHGFILYHDLLSGWGMFGVF